MRLTIGTACFDDPGLFFTLESLFLYHPLRLLDAEIVVVDNHPDGPFSKATRHYCEVKARRYPIRYIPMEEPIGTSPPRDRIFREAAGEIVCVLDSHVLILPGGLERMVQFFQDNAAPHLAAPVYLLYDGKSAFTHFDPVWRGGMWGVWGSDPRGACADAEAFEIPAAGLGAFACRRRDWPGFNPLARGFGGEECYIHEKFRRRGGRTVCLPGFRVVHQFRDQTTPQPYPNRWTDRVRNYLLEFLELGLDPAPVRRHFVEEERVLDPQTFDRLEIEAAEAWALYTRNETTPPPPLAAANDPASVAPPTPTQSTGSKPCGCGEPRAPFADGAEWNRFERQTSGWDSAIWDAMDQYAADGGELLHLWASGAIASALLARPRERYWAVTPNAEWWIGQAARVQAPGTVQWVRADPAEAESLPAAPLAVIEIPDHAAEKWTTPAGPLNVLRALADCERIIILRAEAGATETMESPVRAAIRFFVRERPEWTVVRFAPAGGGWAVLSRRPEDQHRPPNAVTLARNFLSAVGRHLMTGAKAAPPELIEARLAECALCEHRISEGGKWRCALCGCYLVGGVAGSGGKAEWLDQECPIGRWPAAVEAKPS
ncbi:MAG: hypothetical protein Kow0040_17300 [Thermogutta sp.]